MNDQDRIKDWGGGARGPQFWGGALSNPLSPSKIEDITHNPQYAETAIDTVRAQKDEVSVVLRTL